MPFFKGHHFVSLHEGETKSWHLYGWHFPHNFLQGIYGGTQFKGGKQHVGGQVLNRRRKMNEARFLIGLLALFWGNSCLETADDWLSTFNVLHSKAKVSDATSQTVRQFPILGFLSGGSL